MEGELGEEGAMGEGTTEREKAPREKESLLSRGKKEKLMCKVGGFLRAPFNDINCLYFNQKD